MMDERKGLILKGIVDRYIKLGEPVSSQMLLKEYKMPVSSATIRNDMHYLEEHGYIEKSYSSSGRIPTQKGYRFFADWLLEMAELSKRDRFSIMESYAFQRQELEGLLRSTAFLLAELSGLLSFVLAPKLEETKIEYITMVRLDPENILVVVVSNLGIIESRVLRAAISSTELEKINNLLNRQLQGRRLEEIREEAIKFFAAETSWVDPVIRDSFALLHGFIDQSRKRQIYVEGILNLLRLVFTKENGLEEARKIIALLADEAKFSQVLEGVGQGLQAAIGAENPVPQLHNYSMITMDYGYGGILGVLGPIRMDYGKAFSATKYMANRLKAILTITNRQIAQKGD